jgi:uncharacterized protein YggE
MGGDADTVPTMRGVKVFGSAVVRVVPDIASIVVAVSRLEQKPEAAFSKTRDGAQGVAAYLHKAGVKDFGSSRVTLSQEFRYTNGVNKFAGYQAKIEFNVLLQEMDRVDAVLSGLIDAGANTLTSVTFQTTRLKELRADARRRAVMAAREKAELYCAAAGVDVGSVLAIEDVNPESLSGRSEGHTYREPAAVDDAGEPGAIDPGAITIGAAVNVLYTIARRA